MKPNAAKVSATPSAQTVASIDDDILIEIFLNIPLKQLVRLKLVSKHWNFIISAQNFNFLRNQKNANPAVGLIFTVVDGRALRPSSYVVSFDKATDGPELFREIKFNSRWPYATHHHHPLFNNPLEWPCKALNSCNGLLLCKRRGNGVNEPNQIYFVCNPTTNKHFTLPKIDAPVGTWDWHFDYWMCLAFDPSKSPHYKVVCVVTRHNHPIRLEVYSSETRCWIKHSQPFSGRANFSRGVYWNGAIHWIGFTNTGQSLYFNPDNDQVPHVMPTPPMIARKLLCLKPDTYWSCNYFYFGESCGHLHYIDDDKAVTELNVYEMRTDYSEWFVKYRVDCSLIDNRLASMICALVRGKKDEDSFLVWGIEDRIVRHNLVYKTFETIRELDRVWQHPLQYIESLSHV